MKLDHVFRDPALLQTALTHRSWAQERGGPDNQRLEFLGDAVVDLLVGELLCAERPDWDEGALSRARAALVSTEAMAAHGRALELGEALRLGAGAAAQGNAASPKVLEDTFEAVVGAVYLDGGIEAARRLVAGRFLPLVRAMRSPPKDPVSALQELCDARRLPKPRYEPLGASGPDHARIFAVRVHVGDRSWGPAAASKKAAANKAAAALALADLAGQDPSESR